MNRDGGVFLLESTAKAVHRRLVFGDLYPKQCQTAMDAMREALDVRCEQERAITDAAADTAKHDAEREAEKRGRDSVKPSIVPWVIATVAAVVAVAEALR